MRKKTNEEFLAEIKDRALVAIEEYKTSDTKIRFKCSVDGHEWVARPDNISRGSGCPRCDYRKRKTNTVLEDHGDWLLIDISTSTHPTAKMAVDADVWGTYNGGRVYAVFVGQGKYIYARFKEGSRTNLFHHVVLKKKDAVEIDHHKHGSLTFIDNRANNLRYVTRSQNMMNRSICSDNKSGTTGVSWDKQKERWTSKITVNGEHKYLGSFDNIDFAIGARQQAEREYFRDYAFRWTVGGSE